MSSHQDVIEGLIAEQELRQAAERRLQEAMERERGLRESIKNIGRCALERQRDVAEATTFPTPTEVALGALRYIEDETRIALSTPPKPDAVLDRLFGLNQDQRNRLVAAMNAYTPPKPDRFTRLVAAVGEWGNKTFPKATDHSRVVHLRKEVAELAVDPACGEEMADVMMLVFHIAHNHGVDLLTEIERKFEANQQRQWGEPDADGCVEHVRDIAPPKPDAREFPNPLNNGYRIEFRESDGRWYTYREDGSFVFSGEPWFLAARIGEYVDKTPKPDARERVVRDALEAARHELTTLHNLTASDGLDEYGNALSEGCDAEGAWSCYKDETWKIDTSKVVAQLDAVLSHAIQPDARDAVVKAAREFLPLLDKNQVRYRQPDGQLKEVRVVVALTPTQVKLLNAAVAALQGEGREGAE